MKEWRKIWWRPLALPLLLILSTVIVWLWLVSVPPFRSPDLAGEVQSVTQEGNDVLFVVRLSAPKGDGGRYLVRAAGDARVRRRQGGPGAIAVGQVVSVWHHPGVQFAWGQGMASVRAEWVIIERLPR